MAVLVTNSARIRPLTAPERDLGVVRQAPGPRSARRDGRSAGPAARAPTMVSHGPAMTSPAIVTSIPGRKTATWPVPVCGGRWSMNQASSPRPAASGISRYQRGGRGVTRRVTPSGEIWTRRRRQPGGDRGPDRDPECDAEDVDDVEPQVGQEERRPGERDRRERVPQRQEQPEAGGRYR